MKLIFIVPKIYCFTLIFLLGIVQLQAQLPGCGTTINTFPYTEDFEAGVSAEWNHLAAGDNFDWTRDQSGTPSGNTGPTVGDPNWYMFIETSAPTTGQFAYLLSDCFDFTGILPTIEFDYHMYGAAMGSLDLQISTDGVTWNSIWILNGDQGNSWYNASINLAAYAGQTVGFRFVGTDGNSFTGDAAVDNIYIFDCAPQGSCTPLAPWNNTDHISNVNINTINNASGCSAYTDYTAIGTNVNVGSSYILTLTVAGTMGFGVYADCAGWVDWNNDGDFADPNETLSFFDNGSAGPMTALVTVPAGTALGTKTMRLRSAEGGTTLTACNTTANGEVEDYTLNVNTNVAPSITVSITQGAAGSVCLGDMITLDAVPVSASAVTSYQWYYGAYADAEVDADIDASQNGVYSIIVENAAGEAAMATYNLTVNDPPSGGVIGNYTYCLPNTWVPVQLSLAGNGPFSVVIQPGNLTYNNVSNGDMVNVMNDSLSNFLYLTQITDANGCVINLGNPVNEVVNGDGTTLAGWTQTATGGNGWLANGTFRTSFGWDRKFQVIDLVAAGYTIAELDTAPIVYASEQYSSVYDNGDEYSYIVTLQDAAFNTIDQKTISLSNVGSNAWQIAAFTFMGYGPGLRYIRYEHGGVDTEWWAGHYGARMDNSTVTLNVKGNISAGFLSLQCPLPIELLSFDATCNKNQVSLNWSTATEINNDYFTIERSTDAVNFKAIATIKGEESKSTTSNYQWIDDNPINGTAYYRLKQTDFDGAFEYHGIRTASCEKEGNISVFPNPFENSFTVQLSENLTYPIQVKVVDYLGRTVHVQLLEIESTEITLDQQLPTGTYFVKVITEKTQVVERMVKMK